MTRVQYVSLACPPGTSLRPLWAPPPSHSQAGCWVESTPEVWPSPGCPFTVEGGLPGRQQLRLGGGHVHGVMLHRVVMVHREIMEQRMCQEGFRELYSHEVIFDVMVNTWTVEEKYVIQFGLTNSRGTLWGYASQRAGRMKLAMSVKEVKWSKWGWDWAKVKPVMQMEIDAMSVVKCLMMFFLPDN